MLTLVHGNKAKLKRPKQLQLLKISKKNEISPFLHSGKNFLNASHTVQNVPVNSSRKMVTSKTLLNVDQTEYLF